MTAPRESRRIFWMVRLLAAVGLVAVGGLVLVIGVRIDALQAERAKRDQIQERLYQTSAEILRRSGMARAEIIAALNDSVRAERSDFAQELQEMIRGLIAAPDHPFAHNVLKQLAALIERLAAVEQRAFAWRANYDPVRQDESQQRTLGEARMVIAGLRGVLETIEGREHLQEALQLKRWRAARGDTADQLAQSILIEQEKKQNWRAASLKTELTELEGYVELLGSEPQEDNLPNLKDNKLVPALDRIERNFRELAQRRPEFKAADLRRIEELKVILFGRLYTRDPDRQTLRPGADGLYVLRGDLLRLRRERELLSSARSDLSHEIDVVVEAILLSAHAHSAALTRQMEANLQRRWWNLMIAGSVCSVLFLALTCLISRAIRRQVEVIEQARAEADSERLIAQGLMAEQQQAELKYRESALRYQTLVEHAPVAICVNRADRIVLANAACLRLFGAREPGQLLGKSPFELVAPAFHAAVREHIRRAREENRAVTLGEQQIVRLDGTIAEVEVSTAPFHDEGAIGIHVALHDITDRKRAEAGLRASEARLRGITDSAQDAILMMEPTGEISFWNPAAERMLGHTRAEAMGQNLHDLIVPQRFHPAHHAAMPEFQRTGRGAVVGRTVDLAARRKDGREISIQLSLSAIQIDGAWHAVGIIRDITVRKRDEEILRESLREKEVLLKEVHHRVKNNLQVITSLLRLEGQRSDQPGVRETLNTMQSRIRSMALLHETLYRSDNLALVDLATYLTQLASQLTRSLLAGSSQVRLQINLAAVRMEIDQAIPCGLLVNELVTNCLKHGFPGGRSGVVRLDLQPVTKGGPLFQLRVSDDGIGLPADFEARRSKSLGLQLVTDLVRQLQGTLTVGSGPGASFEVMFSPTRAGAAPVDVTEKIAVNATQVPGNKDT